MLPARLIVMLLGITLATSFQYGYHSAVINQPLHFIADFIGNISESRYGVSNESYKTTVASICVTSFIVGGLVGALSSGTISNKLGRKKSILFLTIPCLLGTVLIMLDYLTRSFETIIIGRFLIGCSCGAYTAVAPIYLSEVTPVSLRGMGGVLNQVMIVISVVVSQILGLPSIMNTDVLWPYLLGINVVPCVVGAICLFFCPESPRYLYLAKKDITSAASALKSLRNNPEDVVKELDELAKELDVTSGKKGRGAGYPESATPPTGTSDCFSCSLRPAVIWYEWASVLFGGTFQIQRPQRCSSQLRNYWHRLCSAWRNDYFYICN
ncbi:Solute carrier 2, facilitated glucose transporter member 3, variant 3 [Clonorchis sinensis]|uniref:Solute carrier 2, facilitated glucose transporter member 3, variant 3 n=1 Tax=Clonorchis sinensis TaxID=79923 RepID=A0A8T1MSN1_CLOSI|nr:Solute carrier 2, facilitated glucose transporter member 3, variant 3 [Clonorchis sinensis]